MFNNNPIYMFTTDDNECALNVCPIEADCENTVGSFICHCKSGFRKVSERECEGKNRIR